MRRDLARHVAREVYCEVLFELAEQTGQIEAVLADMAGLAKVISDEPEFSSLMESSQISGEEKAEVIRRVFHGQVSGLTLDFLIVLARRDRINLLLSIANRYELLVDKHMNRVPVEVTVAQPMDEQKREELCTRLEESLGSRVKLTVEVDPSLIGGIVIRKGEKMVDHSIRRALRKAVGRVA